MNLSKLFSIQEQLDKRIVEEHVLQGQDLLAEKILALQVELGELANEWRWFKFWSADKEPRTEVSTGICLHCSGTGNEFYDDETMEWEDCPYCEDGEIVKNPLLEEYVDCFHFILSIGLELKVPDEWVVDEIAKEITEKEISIEEQFIAFNQYLKTSMHAQVWFDILGLFFGLGE